MAGRATIDGGVMIDLSLLRGIHVDPKARTARAQGGLTWNEFNRETQLHVLATTGGVVFCAVSLSGNDSHRLLGACQNGLNTAEDTMGNVVAKLAELVAL